MVTFGVASQLQVLHRTDEAQIGRNSRVWLHLIAGSPFFSFHFHGQQEPPKQLCLLIEVLDIVLSLAAEIPFGIDIITNVSLLSSYCSISGILLYLTPLFIDNRAHVQVPL